MQEEIDITTGLKMRNRKLSNQALAMLIKNENCTAVTLDAVRPDLYFRRAVGVVLSSRGRNDRNDGGALYFVTDMCGHIAKLYLSVGARKQFGSKSDEGALVYLINPTVGSNTDRGYTLEFFVENQQDVVIVGNCSTFGRCAGTRKDGKPCTMPVDISVTDRCPHHPDGMSFDNDKSSFVFISSSDSDKGGGRSKEYASLAASTKASRPAAQSKFPPSCRRDSSTALLSPQGTSGALALDPFEQAMRAAPVHSFNSLSQPTNKTCSVVLGSPEAAVSTADIELNEVHDEVRQAVVAPPQDVRRTGTVLVPQQSLIFSCAKRAAALHPPLPPTGDLLRPSASVVRRAATTNSLLAKPSTGQCGHPIHVPSATERWGISRTQVRVPIGTPAVDSSSGGALRVMGSGGSHSVLLNVSNLHKNAAAAAATSKKRSLPSDSQSSNKAQRTQDPATEAKLAALLSRESAHAEEADNEWFDGFQKRMTQLERQEAKALSEEEIKNVSVRASQCLTCGSLTEYPLELCKKQGHSIQTVATTKRFYECEKCGRRDSTLGTKHLPQHRCPKCSNYQWVVCGKNKTGYIVGTRDSDNDHRLVVSLSSDTSRSDFNRVASVTSSLDHTAK